MDHARLKSVFKNTQVIEGNGLVLVDDDIDECRIIVRDDSVFMEAYGLVIDMKMTEDEIVTLADESEYQSMTNHFLQNTVMVGDDYELPNDIDNMDALMLLLDALVEQTTGSNSQVPLTFVFQIYYDTDKRILEDIVQLLEVAFITNEGQSNSAAIHKFNMASHPYRISCGEFDSFGWITGVCTTPVGTITYG